ncbi:MAG: D-alanine--D-alanine ligase [Candidatus Shapirobacteria bacterium]|nr:D-alanine--D-alanine ligase [Candidatus Shapirobacteria bacterium]
MSNNTVLVIFGGRSVEHEISIITACQAINNFDKKKYNIVPVYIDKNNTWLTGKPLTNIDSFKKKEISKLGGIYKCKLLPVVFDNKYFLEVKFPFYVKKIEFDIAFPIIHGTNGEDGTIQGMFEFMNIPYVGCGVLSSAVGMDKVAQKIIFEKEKINIIPFKYFWIYDWENNKKMILDRVEKLKYPFCVKPSNLGSSVGISIAKNRRELIYAIEVASKFDRKIIVEKALIDMKEINCSVTGFESTVLVSVCEQPIKTEKILSYEDKYIKGRKTKGSKNFSKLIPAPISESLRKQVQEWAKKAFTSLGGSGVSRIDFMYDNKTKKLFLNEINTIPGSLSFYLWEKSGLSYTKLLDKLVNWGLKKHKIKNDILFTYESNVFNKDY